MTENNTIFVTGATGQQGGAVVNHLLSSGWKVRALTRRPNSDKAKVLRNKDVEIVVGDLNERSSFNDPLESVHGIFSVQNFWEHGYDAEIQQGENLADAAKESVVSHFIYSSVGGAERKTGLPHFESKWIIEEYIRSLGLPYTIFRPVSFMENFLQSQEQILNGILSQGFNPESKQQYITVDDIGAFVTAAFDQPELFLEQSLEIAGDELTMLQAVETFGKVIGKPVQYVQTSLEQMRSWAGDEMIRMLEWMKNYGYKSDLSVLRSHYGIKLTTLEDWLINTDWANIQH